MSHYSAVSAADTDGGITDTDGGEVTDEGALLEEEFLVLRDGVDVLNVNSTPGNPNTRVNAGGGGDPNMSTDGGGAAGAGMSSPLIGVPGADSSHHIDHLRSVPLHPGGSPLITESDLFHHNYIATPESQRAASAAVAHVFSSRALTGSGVNPTSAAVVAQSTGGGASAVPRSLLDSPMVQPLPDETVNAASKHLRRKSINLTVKHSTRRTNLWWTSWNLFNDVLGSGVVGLPGFIALSGIGAGPALMFVFMCLSSYTLLLERDLFLRHQISSYAEMCYRAMGIYGYFLANFVIFVFNFGGFVIALIILGSLLPDVLVGSFGEHAIFERRYMLAIAAVVFLPFAFYKSIARFSYLSLVNSLPNFAFCIAIIVKCYASGAGQAARVSNPAVPPHALAFFQSNMLAAFGGVSYLFSCHDMFGHVFHSLENPTPSRVAKVVFAVQGGFFLIGALTGISGYLLFIADVPDNLIDGFAKSSEFGTLCRVLIIAAITIGSPYALFMPRVSVLSMIQLKYPQLVVKNAGPRTPRNILHVCLTVGLMLLALLIAELVTDLGAVFGLIGSLAAVAISLIIPPICYLRLERPPLGKRLQCYTVMLLGTVGSVGCVTSLIQSWSS